MSMSTKEKVTVNATEKEEKNMTNAFDDEMDLRDEAQIAAEEEEANERGELQERKHGNNVGFVRKHKKALIIGGVVVGVAAVGLGLWGVSNIGRGRTFFGRRKYNGGHHHGHYHIDRVTAPVAEIPATGDAAKVIDFANELTRTADAMKTSPETVKVAEI